MKDQSMLSVILDIDQSDEALFSQLALLRQVAGSHVQYVYWISCDATTKTRSTKASKIAENYGLVAQDLPSKLSSLADKLQNDRGFIAFLPRDTEASAIPNITHYQGCGVNLLPWPVPTIFPEVSCAEPVDVMIGWIMSVGLAKHLPLKADADGLKLKSVVEQLNTYGIQPIWGSPKAERVPKPVSKIGERPALHPNSSIAAVIPHYKCEEWLPQALASLAAQTRPLDAIIVIDDASNHAPIEICATFPQVSLYQSNRQVGPYRLVQSIIEDSDFDGFLFQDADDWSAADRLELLLENAAQSGAELIGSQEIRLSMANDFQAAAYPLDVNHAHDMKIAHPLLHPTSLVSKSLVDRLGGFATGMRYSGDTEFLYRAALTARIINIPEYSYYHRIRSNSLTTAKETGMQSLERQALLEDLRTQAAKNRLRKRANQALLLKPRSTAPCPRLRHLTGPAVIK